MALSEENGQNLERFKKAVGFIIIYPPECHTDHQILGGRRAPCSDPRVKPWGT